MLGLRGFPDIQGGVETHVEHLAPLLVGLGYDVEIVVRSPYVPSPLAVDANGVRFHRIWAPRSRSAEALVHTALGVLYASLRRPDILHIQAIGPGLCTPLARLLGLRVVVTHHGADYERDKWGAFARTVLKLGEWAGMRFSNARIVISRHIQQQVEEKYNVRCSLIPNGVTLPTLPTSQTALRTLDIEPGKYVLMVGRIVEEKRQSDLILAFTRANLKGWKLVLVGGADHANEYSKKVSELAAVTNDVVSAGFVAGLPLKELYAHAGVFVLPSSHEGLPIALLEALSYGLPVIASDIPANREIGLPADCYFPVGDEVRLAERLQEAVGTARTPAWRATTRHSVCTKFDWAKNAAETSALYKSVVGLSRG